MVKKWNLNSIGNGLKEEKRFGEGGTGCNKIILLCIAGLHLVNHFNQLFLDFSIKWIHTAFLKKYKKILNKDDFVCS